MNIGKYIHAKLTTDAAVTAIVGTNIYPIILPDKPGTMSIVYMVENNPHAQSKEEGGYHDQANVSLHLWADVSQGQKGYSLLEDLDVAVRDALDYVEGTAGGVTVESCRYLGTTDGRDEQNMFFMKTARYTFIMKN